MEVARESRTNAEWLAGLRDGAADSGAAADLRGLLAGGLSKALRGRADVDPADIDDFAQDGVMRVLARLDSFRGDSKFTTWAMAVAIRVAYTALRKRSWGGRSLEDLGLSEAHQPTIAPTIPSGESADRQRLLEALQSAVTNDLTDRQRTLILAMLAGMPTAVIIEQLGTNANAMYKLYHDARQRLRAALLRDGFTADDVREALGEASN